MFMSWSSWWSIPIAIFVGAFIYGATLFVAASSPLTKAFASFAPAFGAMAGVVVLFAGFRASLDKWIRRRLLDKQKDIDSIRKLSWSQFEMLIGEAYRRQGYQVMENAKGGADGGIDLRLRRGGENTIIQCKQWKVFKVGVKPIRELFGVMTAEGSDRAIFVTSGVYTADARVFAKGKPMQLIDSDELAAMILPVKDFIEAPAKHIPLVTGPASAGTLPAMIPVAIAPVEGSAVPACPSCGNLMVLRTAKRGVNIGSQFWGCEEYPKCKGTRQKG
jgi:restriction system protein